MISLCPFQNILLMNNHSQMQNLQKLLPVLSQICNYQVTQHNFVATMQNPNIVHTILEKSFGIHLEFNLTEQTQSKTCNKEQILILFKQLPVKVKNYCLLKLDLVFENELKSCMDLAELFITFSYTQQSKESNRMIKKAQNLQQQNELWERQFFNYQLMLDIKQSKIENLIFSLKENIGYQLDTFQQFQETGDYEELVQMLMANIEYALRKNQHFLKISDSLISENEELQIKVTQKIECVKQSEEEEKQQLITCNSRYQADIEELQQELQQSKLNVQQQDVQQLQEVLAQDQQTIQSLYQSQKERDQHFVKQVNLQLKQQEKQNEKFEEMQTQNQEQMNIIAELQHKVENQDYINVDLNEKVRIYKQLINSLRSELSEAKRQVVFVPQKKQANQHDLNLQQQKENILLQQDHQLKSYKNIISQMQQQIQLLHDEKDHKDLKINSLEQENEFLKNSLNKLQRISQSRQSTPTTSFQKMGTQFIPEQFDRDSL